MRPWFSLTIIPVAACSSLFGIRDPVAAEGDGGVIDGSSDGRPDDGAPPDVPPVDIGSPLLLSEIVLAPTDAELIEIFNVSDEPIDLTSFFVADTGAYFRLPTGVPVVDTSDFIVQFPPGASIPPKGVVTIAVATAAEFTAAYGVAPTFSIADGTMQPIAATGAPSLTSGGELVAVFFWDGNSDLVGDADIMLAGSPSAVNSLIDKSGVTQDGPDPGTDTTAYKIDVRTITIQMGTPTADLSTKRIALEAGNETQAGAGNGLVGDDESSENTQATWDSTPFGTPTPGAVPAALLQ
jgi:hypothetical protein